MSGVYISYPFCAQKCSFCNFASGIFSRDLQARYEEALLEEIRDHNWAWTPDSVYLGGGTPSQMEDALLSPLLDAIAGRPWQEATIEAAPGSLTRSRVRAWRECGINRVSLGVQSFVKQELARAGRKHDASVVEADCAMLRAEGIANINIDLIAGLPYQTNPSWRESLECVERIAPPHVSVYLFEIDEDSRLGLEVLNSGTRYGAPNIPSDDQAADFYEAAVEYLQRIGIERYEISNFARPGFESHHNLKYWRLDPYVGFGLDAHSFDGQNRHANSDSIHEYLRNRAVHTTPARLNEERIFLGLRLMRGIECTKAEWDWIRPRVDRFMEAGLLHRDGNTLRLTPRGVLLSNEVFQEFVTSPAAAA